MIQSGIEHDEQLATDAKDRSLQFTKRATVKFFWMIETHDNIHIIK